MKLAVVINHPSISLSKILLRKWRHTSVPERRDSSEHHLREEEPEGTYEQEEVASSPQVMLYSKSTAFSIHFRTSSE